MCLDKFLWSITKKKSKGLRIQKIQADLLNTLSLNLQSTDKLMLLSFLPGVRNWNKFTTRKDLQAINITFPFKKVLVLYLNAPDECKRSRGFYCREFALEFGVTFVLCLFR